MSNETESFGQAALLLAVADQRNAVLRILSVMEAVSVASFHQPELDVGGAVELLQSAVREVIDGLDEPMLAQAAIDHQARIAAEDQP